MNLEIKQRVLYLGEKFKLQKNQNPTVRGIASSEGWSKSTVHMDLTKRLEECDKDLYREVRAILDKNKEQRHIRGGEDTKQKYLKRR